MSIPKILPPTRFRPAGCVEWVRWSPIPPPFINTKKRMGKRAQGIAYEKKWHKFALDSYKGFYVPSPWFYFKEVGVDKPRWCQPDGILFDLMAGRITIVECKLQHTSDAWWQLRWLYLPVVSKAFTTDKWNFAVVEVVKWYDPATCFPEKVKMRPDVLDVCPNEFGVHIWKP